MDGEGRRRSARTDLVLRVDYDDPRDLLADYITDLGAGGMFVCTSVPFAVGEKLNFSVSFPRLLSPLRLQGVVRWRRTTETHPDQAPGVGIELVFDNTEHERQVNDLLARLHGRAEPAGPAKGRPFRVLLVEDNQFAHKLFQHAVRRFHKSLPSPAALEIVSAQDGAEAVRLMEAEAVDLAIIDYFLPILRGDDVVRRMRQDERHRDTPILVISVGGDGVREEAMQAGADLYLDKPVLLKQLLNTLQLLLAQHANQSSIEAQA